MITVPEEIKELLHQDHCDKNIRIHFPDGERSDICNDLIVKDTVNFTESLCSRNELKFGLCESPIFECEVVGVGNVKGATIEVFCEIFCPSSVAGAVFKADIQAYVYPISYGTFVIKECKRQSDLNHRIITAYSYLNINDMISEENAKLTTGWYNLDKDVQKYFTGSSLSYVYYNLERGNFEQLKSIVPINAQDLYTYDPMKKIFSLFPEMPTGFFDMAEQTTYTWGRNGFQYIIGQNYAGTHKTNVTILYGYLFLPGTSSNLFYAVPREFDSTGIYNKLLDALDNCRGSIADPTMMMHDSEYHQYLADQIVNHTKEIIPSLVYESRAASNKIVRVRQPLSSGTFVYPRRTPSTVRNAIQVVFPHAIYIESTVGQYGQIVGSTDLVEMYVEHPTPEEEIVWMSCPVYNCTNEILAGNTMTDEVAPEKLDNKYSGYVTVNTWGATKASNYLVDYTELYGMFLRITRNKDVERIDIKQLFGLTPSDELYPDTDLYPEGVTGGKLLPQDYRTCWYDDKYTEAYGAIHCLYKNTNDEDKLYILYLNGFTEDDDEDTYKIYDLSNNSVIKDSKWTQWKISVICANIAENLTGVRYMPVEFVGRGLPYVEVGDTFEILTRSNDSITTIVLSRTISGEMTLTDSYKSV